MGLKLPQIILSFLTVCCFVRLTCHVKGYDSIAPILVQPSDIVGDEIKITGVDNEPDATDEKIHAVGTWYDSSNNEYIIFTINLETGTSSTVLDYKFAWRMNPALTEDVNPAIWFSDEWYLVYW